MGQEESKVAAYGSESRLGVAYDPPPRIGLDGGNVARLMLRHLNNSFDEEEK